LINANGGNARSVAILLGSSILGHCPKKEDAEIAAAIKRGRIFRGEIMRLKERKVLVRVESTG